MTSGPGKSTLYWHAWKTKLRLVLRRPQAARFYVRNVLEALCTAPDAYAVSYPKSGRTWVAQLLQHVVAHVYGAPEQRRDPATGIGGRGEKPPCVRFTHAGSSWEGRITSAHSFYAAPPKRYRQIKILFLYRDPRDVLVSSYYHLNYRTGLSSITRDQLLASPLIGLPKIIRFMNVWSEFTNAHPDRCLTCSYESLRRQPETELGRICRFLDLPAGPEALAAAVSACEFRAMQRREKSGEFENPRITPADPGNRNSYKVRRGSIGEYRSFFTPEQIARMDDAISRSLDRTFPYHRVRGMPACKTVREEYSCGESSISG